MKICYIARDGNSKDKGSNYTILGKLHLFYDIPVLIYDIETDTRKFENARIISELPSYMYLEIKGGECYELNFDKNHRIIPKIEKQPEEIKKQESIELE